MIALYRASKSPRADEIQSRLENLVVAHRVRSPDEAGLEIDELPALQEGDRLYVGESIESFMEELETELKFSRQVSADACYVDPDNPGGCI